MTLGLQIREARKAKGMTQQNLAEALGVTVQAVSQWETNKTAPGAMNLIVLSNLIDLKMDTQLEVRDLLGEYLPGRQRRSVVAPLVKWEDYEKWHLANTSDEWNVLGGDQDYEARAFLDVAWDPVGDVYALRVRRDVRMTPIFQPGDIVIIDTGRSPERGDFVVAIVDGHKIPMLASYFPLGTDEHRAPIFELRLQQEFSNGPAKVDASTPGRVIGTVREHRRFYRTEK